MPDPTDHRAQAEKWLEEARMTPSDDPQNATTCALIGIGHALLAGLLEPVEREWIPPAGTCPRCGRSDHTEAAHDEAVGRIAARRVPPLSPSEG